MNFDLQQIINSNPGAREAIIEAYTLGITNASLAQTLIHKGAIEAHLEFGSDFTLEQWEDFNSRNFTDSDIQEAVREWESKEGFDDNVIDFVGEAAQEPIAEVIRILLNR